MAAPRKIKNMEKVDVLDLAHKYDLTELSMANTEEEIRSELEAIGITDEFLAEQRAAAKANPSGTITTETIGEVPEDNSVNIPDEEDEAVDVSPVEEEDDDDEEYVTIRVPKSQVNAAKAAALPRGKILMKMVRDNFYYEVKGYSFSKEHPFVLVDSDTADYLTEKEEGFRAASPKEAADFYS